MGVWADHRSIDRRNQQRADQRTELEGHRVVSTLLDTVSGGISTHFMNLMFYPACSCWQLFGCSCSFLAFQGMTKRNSTILKLSCLRRISWSQVLSFSADWSRDRIRALHQIWFFELWMADNDIAFHDTDTIFEIFSYSFDWAVFTVSNIGHIGSDSQVEFASRILELTLIAAETLASLGQFSKSCPESAVSFLDSCTDLRCEVLEDIDKTDIKFIRGGVNLLSWEDF